MRKLMAISALIACSSCGSSQYISIDKIYTIKKEVLDGSASRVLYLYVNKEGADTINGNTPGVLIATKNCSYSDKNEGKVLFGQIALIHQSAAGAYAEPDGGADKYRVKFVIGEDFDTWKASGPFCIYYHASRAFGSAEVFSNMLRLK